MLPLLLQSYRASQGLIHKTHTCPCRAQVWIGDSNMACESTAQHSPCNELFYGLYCFVHEWCPRSLGFDCWPHSDPSIKRKMDAIRRQLSMSVCRQKKKLIEKHVNNKRITFSHLFV